MRLLDARALIYENEARLVDDEEAGRPHYTILSHTWDKEEVTFSDIPLGPYHEICDLTSQQRQQKGYSQKSRDDPTNTFPGTFHHWEVTRELSTEELVSQPNNRCDSHRKAGWKKLWNACLQACRDDFDYIWIDTCCIDKSSSTELSEALNSMFKWYQDSAICYVYLTDCLLCPQRPRGDNREQCKISFPAGDYSFHRFWSESARQMVACVDSCTSAQISKCRWATRGWTLQEMIAPTRLSVFDRTWTCIGSTTSFDNNIMEVLSAVTGVDRRVLPWYRDDLHGSGQTWFPTPTIKLHQWPVATRMSWASHRVTTRPEDEAYSLLGLFEVNIPILYGEGRTAFTRLQEEIIKQTGDDSIFAWELTINSGLPDPTPRSLAPNATSFAWVKSLGKIGFALRSICNEDQVEEERQRDFNFELTQRTLLLSAPVISYGSDGEHLKTIHPCVSNHMFLRCRIVACENSRLINSMPRNIFLALRLSPAWSMSEPISTFFTYGSPGKLEVKRDERRRFGLKSMGVCHLALYEPGVAAYVMPTQLSKIIIQPDSRRSIVGKPASRFAL